VFAPELYTVLVITLQKNNAINKYTYMIATSSQNYQNLLNILIKIINNFLFFSYIRLENDSTLLEDFSFIKDIQ
jgi:hypothetical protein